MRDFPPIERPRSCFVAIGLAHAGARPTLSSVTAQEALRGLTPTDRWMIEDKIDGEATISKADVRARRAL